MLAFSGDARAEAGAETSRALIQPEMKAAGKFGKAMKAAGKAFKSALKILPDFDFFRHAQRRLQRALHPRRQIRSVLARKMNATFRALNRFELPAVGMSPRAQNPRVFAPAFAEAFVKIKADFRE